MFKMKLIFKKGGGWFHPVHFHMVDAIIVARRRNPMKAYEVDAAKDTFFLGPRDSVRVLVRFGPVSGSFMFHCQ